MQTPDEVEGLHNGLELSQPFENQTSGQNDVQMPYPIDGFCLSIAPLKEQSSSVPVVCNQACVYSRKTETSIQDYVKRCLRDTRHALTTRNTYQLVSQLRRMLFEWHCILQFISS